MASAELLGDEYFANACTVCYKVHVPAEVKTRPKSRASFEAAEFIAAKPLATCSKCHVARYCSVAHQKMDWPRHKQWCKHWNKMKTLSAELFGKEALPATIDDAKLGERKYQRVLFERDMLSKLVKRPLSSHETTVVKFQPECQLCGDSYSPTKSRKACENCSIISFCTACVNEGSTRHAKTCSTFLSVLESEQVAQYFRALQHPCIWLPWGELVKGNTIFVSPLNVKSLTELSSKSWTQYFKARKCPPVPGSTQDLFTFFLSVPMTLAHVIRLMFDDTALGRCHSLVLHLLGATTTELAFLDKFEEILHLIPALRTLELHFIGPGIPATQNYGYEHDYCDECLERNKGPSSKHKILKVTLFHGLYHEYQTSQYFQSPSVLFALNSGIHENKRNGEHDTWGPTLRKLLQPTSDEKRVPLAVTSYSKDEAIMDAATLEAHKCEFVLPPQENPFGSMQLHREATSLASSRFYAGNSYLQIVKALSVSAPGDTKHDVWRAKEDEIPHIDLIRSSKR